jgi:hypothetical protein
MGEPATPEPVSTPHCPAVPHPADGTAGQSRPGTTPAGTVGGTDSDTVRKIALQKLAFLRDRQRDKGWDNGDRWPVPTVPPTSPERDASGTVTGSPAALDLGVLPTRPCSDCGGKVWWRPCVRRCR